MLFSREIVKKCKNCIQKCIIRCNFYPSFKELRYICKCTVWSQIFGDRKMCYLPHFSRFFSPEELEKLLKEWDEEFEKEFGEREDETVRICLKCHGNMEPYNGGYRCQRCGYVVKPSNSETGSSNQGFGPLCPRCEGGFGSSCWPGGRTCPKCGYPGLNKKR